MSYLNFVMLKGGETSSQLMCNRNVLLVQCDYPAKNVHMQGYIYVFMPIRTQAQLFKFTPGKKKKNFK